MTEQNSTTAPELTTRGAKWFKSSYSDGSGNNCVEIASLGHAVGLRDSKNKLGPALVFSTEAWTSFVGLVRTGAVDFDTL